MSPRILVTQPVHPDVAERLAALGTADINFSAEPLSPAELARRLVGTHAMLGFMSDSVGARTLIAAADLRVVACALKGFDSYDVQACTDAGVWLTVVPDLLTEPTAELAVGLAIALGRHIRQGDAWVRGGKFKGWRPVLYGQGLAGSTVAVLGMGRVGRAVVQRLRGFGCHLLGVDSDTQAPWPLEVQRATLAEALAAADLHIVALPLNAATLHRVGDAEITAARRGALWVNVGRGSVVDEAAMARHLATGQAGGYAADVFEFEDWSLPNRPAEVSPALRVQPHTLFTPHLGSAVASVRRAIEHRAVDNIEAVLRGHEPPDAVNRPRRADRR